MTSESMTELEKQFANVDQHGTGYIELTELHKALDECKIKLPAYRVQDMIDEIKISNPGKEMLSLKEFQQLCADFKSNVVSRTMQTIVSTKRDNVKALGGMSNASSMETTHFVTLEEQHAFSDWINVNLHYDSDLSHLLPINTEGNELYEKVKDGILFCKIINHSCPGTINEHAINKNNLSVFQKYENLTLALCSAQAIGCNIVNIHADNLYKGLPHLVLGLLWQIIRIGLFNKITLEHCPGLVMLLPRRNNTDELLKLSPEAILLHWINHHLKQAGESRQIQNFTSDVKDSVIYTYLLCQIAPENIPVTMDALKETDLLQRAEIMLEQAERLGCRNFLSSRNVVQGNYNLNLAFVANLFNKHPCLKEPIDTQDEGTKCLETIGVMASSSSSTLLRKASIKETREERTYRNWMNSVGVTPYVNWLYSDLTDGLVILQLFGIIMPGVVDWGRVHKMSKARKMMEMLENCNYVVELGKNVNFSLVGIEGHDLMKGSPTLTLALIWQLMRAYTLSILSRITQSGNQVSEKEIIDWVNNKLTSTGKSTILKNFQESSLSDARVMIDLIDAIKTGIIDYHVVREGSSVEDKLENAKYTISMARKIGARVYALPEDITEVVPKMVMTVFACLMAQDFVPDLDPV